MKKQSGITLIALVITIIVLLILAGVSISAITGENGIVDKAKEAAEETEAAQKEEEDILAGYEEELENALKDTSGLNEYGFYFDKLYEGTVVEDGETMGLAYLFHEDGSAEIFLNIPEVTGEYFICEGAMASGTANYEEMTGVTISSDGLTMTLTEDGTDIVLTCNETATLHGLYYGEEYTLTETVTDESTGVTTVTEYVAILNEDGTGSFTTTVTTDGTAAEPTVINYSDLTIQNGYSINVSGSVLTGVSTDGEALIIENNKLLVKE